jgi:hypothetical protein
MGRVWMRLTYRSMERRDEETCGREFSLTRTTLNQGSRQRLWLQTFSVIAPMAWILLSCVGWNVAWVYHRRSVRDWIEANGGLILENGLSVQPTSIPKWREWLGDRAVWKIDPPEDATQVDLDRIAQAFPETRILIKVGRIGE